MPAARHQGRGAPCGESFWHWALGADGGHGHAQPPFRSSRLIGAERQPTSDCRQSLQQSHQFEGICAGFVRETFLKLGHLRPGIWDVHQVSGRNRLEIARYEQYAHLVALDRAAKADAELAAALGSDYTITPDIVVVRDTEDDSAINAPALLVDDSVTTLASLRKKNGGLPLLHASISCKWTIRSDRAQNARSEALNLVRNRKGRLPHVVVVTAEPTPSRLASIALGTGDIDCVYHFALYELQATVEALGMTDAADMLAVMVDGKRLKDISDLPLDLAV
ncbi:type II DNA restriction endonuclease R.NGOI [Pseudomonas aeruginosa C-NN2]|uniref:Putative type II restriction enzyme n=1 Tax=Pseudomonas aeruginosa TaxID=287 RepID=Q6X3F3_PSEAI|nr:putative type II restriction enzyme [Pseudomonas aeruginosa]SMZ53224.1 type II DNA restriction endonuclease R.NGOI [Pseudomonas aeruginosa C-NN2]